MQSCRSSIGTESDKMDKITKEDIRYVGKNYSSVAMIKPDDEEFVSAVLLRKVIYNLKKECCHGFKALFDEDVVEFCPTKHPNQEANAANAMAYMSAPAVMKECNNCKKINEAFIGLIK